MLSGDSGFSYLAIHLCAAHIPKITSLPTMAAGVKLSHLYSCKQGGKKKEKEKHILLFL
jgi:hypothetical protein